VVFFPFSATSLDPAVFPGDPAADSNWEDLVVLGQWDRNTLALELAVLGTCKIEGQSRLHRILEHLSDSAHGRVPATPSTNRIDVAVGRLVAEVGEAGGEDLAGRTQLHVVSRPINGLPASCPLAEAIPLSRLAPVVETNSYAGDWLGAPAITPLLAPWIVFLSPNDSRARIKLSASVPLQKATLIRCWFLGGA